MIGVGLAVACGGDDTPPPTDTSVPPTDVPTANRDPEAEFVWHPEVVRYRAELPFGQLVSLAIDADDTLHLAFTEVSRREFPGVFGTVMYGRGTPQEF